MAFFNFFRKKEQPIADTRKIAEPEENVESIMLGGQHISGPGVHIQCSVCYIPSRRVIIGSSTSTSEPEPKTQTIPVPEDIKDAESLFHFAKMRGPWLPFACQLSEELAKRINETFQPATNAVLVACCGKPVPKNYSYCPYCGQPINEGDESCNMEIDKDATIWLCHQCGSDNPFENKYCGICGKKRGI